MVKDKNTIISEIVSYVASWGGRYSGWYAGIATSPRDRLFNDHAVRENGDGWIYRSCANTDVARSVEDHLLRLGMKGGPGGGDDLTGCVYVYRIAGHTVE